jgi:hypothetical protein
MLQQPTNSMNYTEYSTIRVPLRNRRAERGLFIQKLQHAIPSIVVLPDGLNHLSHNPHGAELAFFQLIPSTARFRDVVAHA